MCTALGLLTSNLSKYVTNTELLATSPLNSQTTAEPPRPVASKVVYTLCPGSESPRLVHEFFLILQSAGLLYSLACGDTTYVHRPIIVFHPDILLRRVKPPTQAVSDGWVSSVAIR